MEVKWYRGLSFLSVLQVLGYVLDILIVFVFRSTSKSSKSESSGANETKTYCELKCERTI